MKRRTLLSSLAATGAALSLPASAQTVKVVFGYTAVTDFASVFVGQEEGFFKKRGLDVEPKFIPVNSTIPAAIQSDSLQMGGPTPSVFLQSVDAGLDHVVLAGGGVLSKSFTDIGLVARAGSGIRTAKDCEGKKVGVPGLGALLHVTFRQWLKLNGADPKKIQFIESSFPQHADLIRGGSLDAVVTGGPFMLRILDSGSGYVAAYYTTFLPEGVATIVHVAKREWVQKNPAAAKAFREGVVEAAAWMKNPANNARLREHIAKYIKLPPAAIASMQISPTGPLISEAQLRWWVDMMNDQEMLKTKLDISKLIAK